MSMDSITESEELEKFSPLSDRRPFEVIIRGGKPWGFSLAGGEGEDSPLHVAEIDEEGRACNSALLPGDILLSVNGISCGGIEPANQLIDSAFRTLTLKVLRGGWDASRGVPQRPHSGYLHSQHQQQLQQLQQQRRALEAAQPASRATRERSGSSQWQDDSALYAQSKASQQSAMKPSRPRRGDSFTVSKSNPPPSPSTADPPWNRPPLSSYDRYANNPHSAPRSSYPDTSVTQHRPVVAKHTDRRYSDAPPTRYHNPRDRDRGRDRDRDGQDRHMVSVKSSPNLVKAEEAANSGGSGSGVGGTLDNTVKPVRSSSDIPDDVGRESTPSGLYYNNYGSKPAFLAYEQQQPMLSKLSSSSAEKGYYGNNTSSSSRSGGGRYSLDDQTQMAGDRDKQRGNEQAKRYSDDMYTSDMKTVAPVSPSSSGHGDPRSFLTAHSLRKYQPDYENVSLLGTAPLQSEKISELLDSDLEDHVCGVGLDGGQDPGAPIVPPRPSCVTDSKIQQSPIPNPPHRDPSSLKYIKVNQNHEKYPSWPVTQASVASAAGSDHPSSSQPINTRAQSWTDHTNTHKEFPSKQRLAYQPGLRPLPEKNSPNSSGEEATASSAASASSSKAPRNSSDPGLKTPEFGYDRYGRVVQLQQKRAKEDEMKGRFEDFYHNSKPGYLPPRFDSDGHSYGDKEYSAPSPPERDVAAVDRHALSQALGSDAGDQQRQHQQHSQQRQPQQPQPQEPLRSPSHLTAGPGGPSPSSMPSSQRDGPPPGVSTTNVHHPTAAASSPSRGAPPNRPGNLPTSSSSSSQSRHVDTSTSPLASPRDAPHGSLHQSRSGMLPTSAHRDYLHRDVPPGSGGGGGAGGGRHPQYHKPFIVKQTPYYNTSTQTDVLHPSGFTVVKSSDRTGNGSQHCNAEVQVSEASSQTSPKSPADGQDKQQQIQGQNQTRGSSRELLSPTSEPLDPTSPTRLSGDKRGAYFRFPFEGMQSIQAKYATDEEPVSTPSSSSTAKTKLMEDVFAPLSSGDQASIMRKLSEEFYGGNRLGLMGMDKGRHSSASSSQEHSPKPNLDPSGTSGLSVYSGGSGTMSQAESYSSVVIHASESAGPFGRDDFGSQSSIADSRHGEVTSSSSRSSQLLRDTAPRGRNSLEYFPRSAPRPLLESKKFNSLSAIGQHQRELSAPVSTSGVFSASPAQSQESLQSSASTRSHGHHPEASSSDAPRWRNSSSNSRKDTSSTSDASSPSVGPKSSTDARTSGSSSHFSSLGESPASGGGSGGLQSGARPTSASRHARTESDSVFLENSSSASGQRDRRSGLGAVAPKATSFDSAVAGRGVGGTGSGVRQGGGGVETLGLGRKLSMKKAYGTYDESDYRLLSPTKENKPITASSVSSIPSSSSSSATTTGETRNRGSYSDAKQLDQIQEEGDSNTSSSAGGRDQRASGELVRYPTQGNVSDPRQRLDSWRNDLDKRTGRAAQQRSASTEQPPSTRTIMPKTYENSISPMRPGHRMPYDGSIDSGVGSEISSRADSQMTSSASDFPPPPPPLSPGSVDPKTSGLELKKFQQQAVLNFVQRKTSGTKAPSFSSSTSSSVVVEHSPEASLYESIGTPRSPHSPTSETVSDLITKTNENLAKRADSIRRSGSTSSSRASSSDYMDMGRGQDRGSRKETEWSRLRSSGSLPYGGSNRSSLCSENTYEDISVFATPSQRGSTQEMPEGHKRDSQCLTEDDEEDDGSKMETGMMASPNYQNFPGGGASRRRPPPPPPRTPSPEPRSPPALPPRNYYHQRRDGDDPSDLLPTEAGLEAGEEGGVNNVDEAKIDFKSLFHQWESHSPREDAYAAQLRKQAMKISTTQQRAPVTGPGSTNSSSSASSSATTAPTSMSVIHSRTQMGISTSYKRQPMVAQEATTPTGSASGSSTSSVSPVSGLAGGGAGGASSAAASPAMQPPAVAVVVAHHRHTGSASEVSASAPAENSVVGSLSPSSSSSSMLTSKDSPTTTSSSSTTTSPNSHSAQHAAGGAYVDRDTKPTSSSAFSSVGPAGSAGNRPPQLPERSSRDDINRVAANSRADNLPPREGRSPLVVIEVQNEAHMHTARPYLHPPHQDIARDRSASDSRVLDGGGSSSSGGGGGSGTGTPVRDPSRSPARPRRDVPVPSPPQQQQQHLGKVDQELPVVAGDHGELPPPPPELLNNGGSFDKGEQPGDEPFADDSYGAYRNRSSRPVGTYKRSSSAAVLRPDNSHIKAATDANSVFGDPSRALAPHHGWNSDSQLQATRGGGVPGAAAAADGQQQQQQHQQQQSNGVGGGRPPDRGGNRHVPAFKADSGPVRNVVKVTAGPQPLTQQHHQQQQQPQQQHHHHLGGHQSPAAGQDVKTFTARPYRAEPAWAAPTVEEREEKTPTRNGNGNSNSAVPNASPKQGRSVKDRVINLERKSSFTSSSSTPTTSTTTPNTSPQHTASASSTVTTTTSASQRWANAASFESTHLRSADHHHQQQQQHHHQQQQQQQLHQHQQQQLQHIHNNNTKPQRAGVFDHNSNNSSGGSNNNNTNNVSRVPNSRPKVLTDSPSPSPSSSTSSPSHHPGQARDRVPPPPPTTGSSSPSDPPSSTQSSGDVGRPRAYSERTRRGEYSPSSASTASSDSKPSSQRYAEVTPVASDSRGLPGHIAVTALRGNNPPSSSSTTLSSRERSSSSPYSRRESLPATSAPPEPAVVAMVSPRRKSEGSFLSTDAVDSGKDRSPPPPPPGEITVCHGRQPSQEELECDLQARELAREVAGSEQRLSDVLTTDATKKRMKYMDGLFSGGPADFEVKTPASIRRHQSHGPGDHGSGFQSSGGDGGAEDKINKRNSLPKEYFVSPQKAVLEMEWRKKEEAATDLTKNIHDNEALIRQKEELIEKLYKKMELLKEERTGLQAEITENDALGRRVRESVEGKCQNPSERDKFCTYIDDLEKIVRLLLNLSGQLARAENAVQSLSENTDPKLKKMTLDKRERLQVKHAEAKQLKEDIDKRSDTVSGFLRQSLSGEELNDYAYFVKMKSKLTIDLQELEDKITLGEEQIQELKKSIPERTPAAPESASSASSSPRASPVPSSSTVS